MDRLEESDAIENARIVENILSSDGEKLEKNVAYWSVQNATYEFFSNNQSNYEYNAFQNQEIDFIFFYDATGKQVSGKITTTNQTSIQAITQLEQDLEENSFIPLHNENNQNKTGFLTLNGVPVMLSIRTLEKKDKTLPIAGTIIAGNVLDEDEIRRLHELTGMEIKVKSYNKSNPDTTVSIDNGRINSYAYFDDIYGEEAFSLKISRPRSIHQQGITTITNFLIILVLTGAVFTVSGTALLEKSIVSPLKRLKNEITFIGQNEDFSKRVELTGNDEVASIGKSINNMLESLEKARGTIEKKDATITAILQTIPDMMFQIRKDGTISNYKLSTDNCIYQSPDTELSISLDDVLPADVAAKELEIIDMAFKTNKMQTMQYTMPVKGEIRNFEVRMVVSGENEVLAVVSDVTELKQAEEMRRKDLLLKEIHHRVKNNLQIISSLLRLQSRKFTDKETVEAFRKSQNRAKSMAIAHEKLYQSSDLENIEFGTYIETLTGYLVNNYGYNPNDIKINIRIKNLTQGIDTAIPLGLIITELVSNSLKYAFDDHKGEIIIEITPEDEGFYLLSIKDNGKGFPENVDFKNTESLGMRLVVSC
ncbi:MAG: histidine kinase dimerization/phosphoacceptor domain -containing protein [Methanolobus sp.]